MATVNADVELGSHGKEGAHHHIDPAPRLQIAYSNLKYTVKVKVKKEMESRDLLRNISGAHGRRVGR